MIRIKPLPDIALTDLQPAFYDVESVTAIQMVSKFYKYLQDIVNDYNSFTNEVNDEISNQNATIEDAVNYMTNNIIQTATEIINQAIEDGLIEVATSYNSENEELTIYTSGDGENNG